MKYLVSFVFLTISQGLADYVQEQPAPKCYQAMNGSSVMKLEYEYKLGFNVILIIGNNKPIKKYVTKTFLNSNAAQFIEIDCEAFFWGL